MIETLKQLQQHQHTNNCYQDSQQNVWSIMIRSVQCTQDGTQTEAENTEKQTSQIIICLVYLFNGISTTYGLFNAEIRFISNV